MEVVSRLLLLTACTWAECQDSKSENVNINIYNSIQESTGLFSGTDTTAPWQVMKQVREQIREQVMDQVRKTFMENFMEQVMEHDMKQAREWFMEQVKEQVREEVVEQVMEQVRKEVMEQVMEQVRKEVMEQVMEHFITFFLKANLTVSDDLIIQYCLLSIAKKESFY